MSRAYRVTVRGSVQRVVHVEDGVCTDLELLPIVSKERTAALLAAELEARGFTTEAGVARRAMDDGISVEVDLAKGSVRVRAEASATVAVEREHTAQIFEEQLAKGREQAQAHADAEAERAAKEAEEAARREVTSKLERRLADLQKELDGVVNRVTAEALKEKAASLGRIEELSEDPTTGDVTIKVKIG